MNPFADVNWKPGKVELRKFGITLCVGFAILLAAVLAYGLVKGRGEEFGVLAKTCAGGIGAGLVAIAIPPLARPLYLIWYVLGCSVGYIVSNLLLAAVFFIVVTAVGFARRRFPKQVFFKHFDRKALSYWTISDGSVSKESYFNEF